MVALLHLMAAWISLNLFLTFSEASDDSKLLLFLLDGFRWDYMDTLKLDLPGFRRIISQGVKAEYMTPAFPSLSFPNYYSIMTGKHCEGHGMVGNNMYDVKHNEFFLLGTNEDQYHSFWWDDGESLWVTAEKQNKRSYMYFWCGCEVSIRGVNATYCDKYKGIPTLQDLRNSIDSALKLFGNGSADVVGIYVELLDSEAHRYGPSSAQLKKAITDIDVEINKLLSKLSSAGLLDNVNIMVFSDHGMAEVSESRVVNISKVVDMDDIKVMLEKGSNVYIWPKEEKLDKVYNDLIGAKLDRVNIYKKSDIPDRWYYKNHYRIAPILLVAGDGWYIVTPKDPNYYYYPVGPMKGHHGFDNAIVDMRSIFIATGPEISVKKTIKPFENIHLYQVMCKILGIEPSKNDGDWAAVKGLLKSETTSSAPNQSGFPVLFAAVIIQLFILLGVVTDKPRVWWK